MNAKVYIPCVNCGLNLNRIQKQLVADENENFRNLLSDWTCKELENDDRLCMNCYDLVHQSLKTDDKTRKFGRKSICFSCGISLLRRRWRDITKHPEQKLVLAQRVQPHQVKQLKHVCVPCWLQADRAVRKQKRGTKISEDLNDPLPERRVHTPTPPNNPEIPTINLTSYKRTANTSRRCIFKNCNGRERLTLPRLLKKRLLIDFAFYVTDKARICNAHLNNTHNEWRDLLDEHCISEFTSDQLEDLCSLLKSSTDGHYSNEIFQKLIGRDEVLCKYWLGVDHKEFENMLEAIQPIKHTLKFPTKSLAMYLMKRHTGFTDKKVAQFFLVSVTLLNKNVSIMQKYFENRVTA